jgi:hypothetical protein
MHAKLDAMQVHSELQGLFPAAMISPRRDRHYAVIARSAVAAFHRELAREQWRTDTIQWSTAWDCDDFALAAVTLASRKHHLAYQSGVTDCDGIAFGLLYYRQDIGGAHARNILRTGEGWETYEPQLQNFSPISVQERAETFFVFI